jgi:hypothetical protein
MDTIHHKHKLYKEVFLYQWVDHGNSKTKKREREREEREKNEKPTR